MKKIIFTILVFCAWLGMNAQAIYSEDFEGTASGATLPAGMSVITSATDGGYFIGSAAEGSSTYWTIPDTGGQMAYSNDDSCNCDKADDKLILPTQDLSSYSSVTLTASVFHSGAYGGFFDVEVSTDGTTWTSALSIAPDGGFQTITANLDAYAGMAGVQVAFRYNDNGAWGAGVAIDDVSLDQFLCGAPSAIAAANVTLDAADLTWTDGNGCVSDKTVTVSPAIAGSPFTVACGTESLALTGLMSGTAYTVTIANDCTGTPSADASFTTLFPPPSNDDCSGTIDLTAMTSPVIGNTCQAVNDFNVSCLTNTGAQDVVYSIDVPDGYELVIGQTFNDYDSKHRLAYGGVCPGDTEVGCIDDDDYTNITFLNTTGATQTAYWIQSAFSTGCGDYTLAWTLVEACNPPTAVAAAAITDVAADITWVDGAGCTTAKTVTVTPAIAGSPFTVACGMEMLSLTGLTAETEYTVSVANDCAGTPSADVVFTTSAACAAPSDLAAANVTLDAADITWSDGAGCVTEKTVTVDPAIAGSPFTVACGTGMLALTGLTEGTAYTVTIANDCGAAPSEMLTFNTAITGDNCATSIDLTGMTSPIMGNNTLANNDYVLDCLTNSGAPDMVYTLDVPDGYTLSIGQTFNDYDSEIRLAYGGACPGDNLIACTDDPDYTTETWTNETGSMQTVYWLQSAFSTGAGDFTLEWSLTAPCVGAPTNVAATATGGGNVLFTWDDMPDTDLYQVKYRERGTTAWTSFGTTITQRNEAGFDDNKQYQYKMRRKCTSGEWSEYTAATMFPGFYSNTCPEATGVSSVYLDDTRFRVRWDKVDEVKGRVRYREVGTSTWLIAYGLEGNNYVYVTDLTPGADYEYRVRINCEANDWSPYNALYFHSLGVITRENQVLTGVAIYPNPVSDVLNITYENDLGAEATVEVFDMLGRAMISEVSNDNRIELNVNQLAEGSYVVSIMVDGKQSIQKFVKK